MTMNDDDGSSLMVIDIELMAVTVMDEMTDEAEDCDEVMIV